ncbi:hypothetical protein Slin14017_G054500 [Septoria linicola]|nr:hypothetical protein Slin14017_G054500 [Septoria linicola]
MGWRWTPISRLYPPLLPTIVQSTSSVLTSDHRLLASNNSPSRAPTSEPDDLAECCPSLWKRTDTFSRVFRLSSSDLNRHSDTNLDISLTDYVICGLRAETDGEILIGRFDWDVRDDKPKYNGADKDCSQTLATSHKGDVL